MGGFFFDNRLVVISTWFLGGVMVLGFISGFLASTLLHIPN